jgi:hypothetical protein
MIELNTSLLSQTTLENLMGDIIARKEPHLTRKCNKVGFLKFMCYTK